jgi:hypothetical protein
MNSQATTGIPKIMCDGDYRLNKCLYLDSAEYVLQKNKNLFMNFITGLGDAFTNVGIGFVISTTYTYVCRKDLVPSPDLLAYDLKNLAAWKSVGCGLAGSYFGIKELLNSLENPFYAIRNMDPAADQDYCKDLDYSEASDVIVQGGDDGYKD